MGLGAYCGSYVVESVSWTGLPVDVNGDGVLPEKFRIAIYNQIRDNMQWKILWKRIFHDNFVPD